MTVDQFNAQVVLDGVDITDHVDFERQISISSALNEELDVFNLTLLRPSELASGLLNGWKEIYIYNGASKAFGGYLLNKDKVPGKAITSDCVASGSDFGAYLDKVYVTQEFKGMTDKAIIAAVFAASADLIDYDGATYVEMIATIDRVVCNRWSVRVLLDWLVDKSGGYWYVDYDKQVHYFATSEYRAPFDITHDPADTTKETAEDVSVTQDATGVVNIVEVVGGNALSGDDTFKFTKSGYDSILQLDKRLSPWDSLTKIAVRRNDGGATTNLLVNPSFETNITDGWTQYQAGSGAAWAQDSTKHSVGSKSAKITAGTAMAMLRGAAISLAPGEALSVQAMAWCNTAGMASVVIYDSGNSVILSEISNRTTSTWEKLSTTYINNGAASLTVRIELRNNGVDSAQIAYFDCAQAEKIACPTAYCDGTLGTGYAWTGTAHNSTSTRVNMPVWTTMTVKTSSTDTLTGRDEVIYNDSLGTLEQELYWPTMANGIEVDGQEEKPVRLEVRNYSSYAFFGKWLKTVIIDSTILDLEVARLKAATELAKNADEIETAKFTVRRSGLRSGQTIGVDLPLRSLSGDYFIRSVETTIGIGGYLVSIVSIGALDADLVQILLRLKRATNPTVTMNNNERLDQILFSEESIGMTETIPAVVSTNKPYRYGQCKYGFAKYG